MQTTTKEDIGSDPSAQAPLPESIRKAQDLLAVLGYDPGPVDGVLGKKTQIAIKHFQVDEEVDVDGILTADILARMEKAVQRQGGAPGQTDQAQGTAGKQTSAIMAAARAGPVYEIGDVYVYDNGQVETVTRVGPEQTHWETAANDSYTAYRNFTLPPNSWKTGSSTGENRIQPAEGEKWPPAARGRVSFLVGSKATGESADATLHWSGKWHCVTGGTTFVKAIVGRFKTIAIQCERTKPAPGTWKKRIWYYAPSIGHYVRRVDLIHTAGRKKTVELVAISPGGKGWPAAARGGLDWAVQSALDSGRKDKPVEWQSSAVGATFHIRLVGNPEKLAPSGTICRRYVIERAGTDHVRRFPAVACKRPGQERWLIPGLNPGAPWPSTLRRK